MSGSEESGRAAVSEKPLSDEQRIELLRLARESLGQAVKGKKLPNVDLACCPAEFRADGASFVTLTIQGQLRGCIGALEAYQPFVLDVIEHAAAAGVEDYRFHPVSVRELPTIRIEISRLTSPLPLVYADAEDLLHKLRPGVDGVIVRDGRQRATFLPQVWEQLSSPAEFLEHLCHKMGARPDLWRRKNLDVLVYQVEEFHE